jgi:sugar phosphate isomerase/epimerase
MGSSDRFIPGLVSVTFRALLAEQIVALADKAKLRSIEWGGDVHVPHGDLRAAATARRLCDERGLLISAYGSYYRAGVREGSNPSFQHVLETAVALGASRIRVWAGNGGSAGADADTRKRIVDDLRAICADAATEGLSVGLEYHDRTLTDTPESALSLCDQVAAPNLRCNWQPRVGLAVAAGLRDIQILRPHLGDVHVFCLSVDRLRLPLADGAGAWQAYLAAIAKVGPMTRHVSLEFVKDDNPNQLLADARVLHGLMNRVNKGEQGEHAS